MNRMLALAVLMTAPLLAGCLAARPQAVNSAAAALDCAADEKPALRSTLYLGAGIPGGGRVDAAAWQDFLASEASTRFPDGLTWFDGHGQWRSDREGLVQESSRVLVLLHTPDFLTRQRVDAIAVAYKKRFSQEAVLLERSAICMALR